LSGCGSLLRERQQACTFFIIISVFIAWGFFSFLFDFSLTSRRSQHAYYPGNSSAETEG